jgi:dTDP-4-dehydrorhamnose reductase
MSNPSVRPADIRDYLESVVISWIEQETPAPIHLLSLLARYRDLSVYRDEVEDPKPVDLAMDAIFDRLIATATGRCRHTNTQRAVSVAKQKRRIERSLPWVEQCNRAIQRWRQGVRA